MPAIVGATFRRVCADFGGSTFRRMFFDCHPGERLVQLAEQPFVEKRRFTSARQLGDFIGQNLGEMPGGQTIVPISFAGPVAKDMRTLLKYTNQDMVERNIPFADMIETSYQRATGRTIKVFLLHDCLAAGWAVVNKGGILTDAPVGTWLNPIVHGTGVGGRNFEIIQPGVLIGRDGNYEFGHANVFWDLLAELKLAPLVPDARKCGCTRDGFPETRKPVCFEQVAAGPAIKRYGENIFRLLTVLSTAHVRPGESLRGLNGLSDLAMTPDVILKDALFTQVLSRLGRQDLAAIGQISEARALVAAKIDAPDFTAALKAVEGDKYIARTLIDRVAQLFAHRMEWAQSSHEETINFVFVGGAGCNLGPYMKAPIVKEIGRLNGQGRRTVWDIERLPQLKVEVDTFPADQTNLAGAAYWLMRQEASPGPN